MHDTIFSTLAERSDSRIPDSGARDLFTVQARWQAWLDVERALALAEAELGVIPGDAARAIAAACRVELLDLPRLQREFEKVKHPFMPLVTELSLVVGEPHGGWVHWGATTQNMTQTGDILIIRKAQRLILGRLRDLLSPLAGLAERGADLVMAGRTHGQHAVPITFGLKVAAWIDEIARHVDRLIELEPRLFVALLGGAVGSHASFAEAGARVQDAVARLLGLAPMRVPSRSTVDHHAELVCVLGMLAATSGKIAREIYNLMRTEYGEVEEPIPAGAVGSSTMPQKRNPVLCMEILGISAEARSIVALSLESIQGDHEADQASNVAYECVRRSAVLSCEILDRLVVLIEGLRLDPVRMRANIGLSGGTIMAESIMLELGRAIGRQAAHEVVFEAAQAAARGPRSFIEILAADARVATMLESSALASLIDPASGVGLSPRISREQADVARRCVERLNVHLEGGLPGTSS